MFATGISPLGIRGKHLHLDARCWWRRRRIGDQPQRLVPELDAQPRRVIVAGRYRPSLLGFRPVLSSRFPPLLVKPGPPGVGRGGLPPRGRGEGCVYLPHIRYAGKNWAPPRAENTISGWRDCTGFLGYALRSPTSGRSRPASLTTAGGKLLDVGPVVLTSPRAIPLGRALR